MKKKLIFLFLPFLLQACYEPGEIKIENRISNARITDVYWGPVFLASDLLPGESSQVRTIEKDEEELPSAYKVSFVMKANNQSVFLETEELFNLDEDQSLNIILDDNTAVFNPNE